MNYEMRRISELIPYEKNPRKNDKAVESVANSIKEFGFKVPIVIDKNSVVVCGHTRLKAAKKLELEEVPCVIADDLTDEQIKAFRLADNKSAEIAEWDFDILSEEIDELADIDMTAFGFDLEAIADELINNEETEEEALERQKREFEERMAAGELDEDDEEYQEFLKKFEAKKTTDDCYTPEVMYEGIANYVAKRYGLKRVNFVRPFYPGGDYEKYDYKDTDVVVDNPPFSILSQITKFYSERGIRFFLFAPSVSIFNCAKRCTALCIGGNVTYENGANVPTSFVTNLESSEIRFKSDPELYEVVKKANQEFLKEIRKEMPKYKYPIYLVTAAACSLYSKYGVEFEVRVPESFRVSELDAQKEYKKGIFGGGYLISEREKAEREKAITFELSEREMEIIKKLGAGDGVDCKRTTGLGDSET